MSIGAAMTTAPDYTPALPGEERLTEWVDRSEPGIVGTRILAHPDTGIVATLIVREHLVDVVLAHNGESRIAVCFPDEVIDELELAARERSIMAD